VALVILEVAALALASAVTIVVTICEAKRMEWKKTLQLQSDGWELIQGE